MGHSPLSGRTNPHLPPPHPQEGGVGHTIDRCISTLYWTLAYRIPRARVTMVLPWHTSRARVLSWHILYEPWLIGVFPASMRPSTSVIGSLRLIWPSPSARAISTANFLWPRSRVAYTLNTPLSHGLYYTYIYIYRGRITLRFRFTSADPVWKENLEQLGPLLPYQRDSSQLPSSITSLA